MSSMSSSATPFNIQTIPHGISERGQWSKGYALRSPVIHQQKGCRGTILSHVSLPSRNTETIVAGKQETSGLGPTCGSSN